VEISAAVVKFLLKLPKRTLMLAGAGVLVVILWGIHAGLGWLHRVNSASFSPAAVSLTVDNGTGSDEYTALNLTSLYPGASLYAGMTVANTGSGDFTYCMVSTASGDARLAADVRISVADVAAGACNSAGFAAGISLAGESRGLAGPSFSGRVLRAGTSEYLCFHVRLPAGLPSSLQGASAQATLNFTAQQS
jgi:hypothetical protein